MNVIDLKKKYDMIITGVIHIGAHHGEDLQNYIDIDVPDMLIFEPLKTNYQDIQDMSETLRANIEGYQMALGSQVGTSTIKNEEVEVDILDNFKSRSGNYNFININAEGSELEVLKGGMIVLNQINYVYFKNNSNVEETDEFLSEYGMERMEDFLYIKTKGETKPARWIEK